MIKTISTSRRNFYDYKIFEKFVAGMVLTGNEIKAMRSGSISIVGSYLTNNGTDFFINEISIPPYKKSHPVDSRKKKKIRLLLKKREMFKLSSELKSKNLFLIPLRIFINEKGWAKVEVALSQRLKKYQIKNKIKEKEIDKRIRTGNFQ